MTGYQSAEKSLAELVGQVDPQSLHVSAAELLAQVRAWQDAGSPSGGGALFYFDVGFVDLMESGPLVIHESDTVVAFDGIPLLLEIAEEVSSYLVLSDDAGIAQFLDDGQADRLFVVLEPSGANPTPYPRPLTTLKAAIVTGSILLGPTHEWQPNTAYVLGDTCWTDTDFQGDTRTVLVCTQAGVSGATEPDWQIQPEPTIDASVRWLDEERISRTGIYRVYFQKGTLTAAL